MIGRSGEALTRDNVISIIVFQCLVTFDQARPNDRKHEAK